MIDLLVEHLRPGDTIRHDGAIYHVDRVEVGTVTVFVHCQRETGKGEGGVEADLGFTVGEIVSLQKGQSRT